MRCKSYKPTEVNSSPTEKYLFKSKLLRILSKSDFLCKFLRRITYSNPGSVLGGMKIMLDADITETLVKNRC